MFLTFEPNTCILWMPPCIATGKENYRLFKYIKSVSWWGQSLSCRTTTSNALEFLHIIHQICLKAHFEMLAIIAYVNQQLQKIYFHNNDIGFI